VLFRGLRRRIGCGGALLALAACGSGGEGNQAISANDAVEQLAAVQVRAGLWEVNSDIVSASQQGLPPEMAEQMKGRRRSARHCITAEQAARPNAHFLAARGGEECVYSRFEMRGGRLSGAMTCRDADGAETQARMSGAYDAESYRTRMDIRTPGIGSGRVMILVVQETGRRVGDCPREETKQ
jgi:hypothetical protein